MDKNTRNNIRSMYVWFRIIPYYSDAAIVNCICLNTCMYYKASLCKEWRFSTLALYFLICIINNRREEELKGAAMFYKHVSTVNQLFTTF